MNNILDFDNEKVLLHPDGIVLDREDFSDPINPEEGDGR